MNKLFEYSRQKIEKTNIEFNRYLLSEIDFNQRLIGIKGARGTGKTTLILEQLKKYPADKTLYISLDNLYFSTNSIFELAEYFSRIGGEYLYVDEVHKYPNWIQEIKNIYDTFTNLKIVFTGSSAIEISKSKFDLSRRALIYDLKGLSFREFLTIKYKKKFSIITLEQLLNYHQSISASLLKQFKPFVYFTEYLEQGYYPYFTEDETNYQQRLGETINTVIESDLPAIYNIDYNSIIKLKKLVYLLGRLVPYIPNINKLAKQIGTTRDTLLKYLHLLHNADILNWLSSDAWGINFMNKPEKLYLENTNISKSLLGEGLEKGTIRETFFANQLRVKHKVNYSKQSDFFVDNKYTFEIGGKNKNSKQISNINDAYIAADDIEFGHGKFIPLWLFGFLY